MRLPVPNSIRLPNGEYEKGQPGPSEASNIFMYITRLSKSFMLGKTLQVLIVLLFAVAGSTSARAQSETDRGYLQNRAPLSPARYLSLPLGDIHPEGWLRDKLERMANGMTGNLDWLYPEVVGPRNGWLGGDGDGWERGPYWIDGLLPLAYQLDNDTLKAKALAWVEWTLNNQAADGYLGPIPFAEPPPYEAGLQRGNRRDWWPKMVMLKILRQYYSATADERVLTALTDYFRYQLRELPDRPLDSDTFWANRRGADNLEVVHWLYSLTGDDFLLDLARLLDEQTFPWDEVFTADANVPRQPRPYQFFRVNYPFDSSEMAGIHLADMGTIHTVNLAQGLKQPILRYQATGDERYLNALHRGLDDIRRYHGQVQGMYGGDEPLHGTSPVQGVEFCAISEAMFSLETVQRITGDVEIADLLERIAYNALPTQADDHFTGRQYFQAANQVELRENSGLSYENHNHNGTDFVYGLKTGYPCCTTNMHQSWPKFVQNLFYATPDGGVAALQYGPATAEVTVGDGVRLAVTETTGYPFRETVDFTLSLAGPATFPFHLRIPTWAEGATATVNGQPVDGYREAGILIVEREWQDGDVLQLRLPMSVTTSTWHDYSMAVERGPLVYALGIAGESSQNEKPGYGSFTEYRAAEDWNFGLIEAELDNPHESVTVKEHDWDGSYPWNLEAAPVSLTVKAVKIPEWEAANGVPHLPAFHGSYGDYEEENIQEITLVPYGCTTLRISTFPVYRLR